MKFFYMAVVGVLGCAMSLSAETLLVTTSGTFAAGTPTTSWTAAGDTWDLSFNIDSTPTPISSSAGVGFVAPVSNFVYDLDGTPTDVTPVEVDFYSTSNLGIFDVCFFSSCSLTTPTDGLQIEGAQAYSGTEDSPTILTGVYGESDNEVFNSGNSTIQDNGTVTISDVTTTPEPSTLVLMLGCGALFMLTRRVLVAR